MCVYTSCLRMYFTHWVAFWKYIRWFSQTSMNQCNYFQIAIQFGKRMRKCGYINVAKVNKKLFVKKMINNRSSKNLLSFVSFVHEVFSLTLSCSKSKTILKLKVKCQKSFTVSSFFFSFPAISLYFVYPILSSTSSYVESEKFVYIFFCLKLIRLFFQFMDGAYNFFPFHFVVQKNTRPRCEIKALGDKIVFPIF